MSDKKVAEIRAAYEVWVAGNTVSDVSREPESFHSFEFMAFLQGYHFGKMSDVDFDTVVARLTAERDSRETP